MQCLTWNVAFINILEPIMSDEHEVFPPEYLQSTILRCEFRIFWNVPFINILEPIMSDELEVFPPEYLQSTILRM